jgi:hypothetical protein
MSTVTFASLLKPFMPEVEEELGGAGPARDFLYAQAFRQMIKDGPYVWEMSPEERTALAAQFYEEFAAADEEGQEHMMMIVCETLEWINQTMGPRKPAIIVEARERPPDDFDVVELTTAISERNEAERKARRNELQRARRKRKAEAKARQKQLDAGRAKWLTALRSKLTTEDLKGWLSETKPYVVMDACSSAAWDQIKPWSAITAWAEARKREEEIADEIVLFLNGHGTRNSDE